MSIINPILEEHVNPHLSKIVEVIKEPMTKAYEESYQLWDKKLGDFGHKGTADELKKHFKELDWYPNSWDMWGVVRKTDELYEPLWALNLIFPDIYPWGLIWKAHDELRHRMDNAIYTWEDRVIKTLEGNPNATADEGSAKALYAQLKEQTMADYKFDGEKGTVKYFAAILKVVVMPPFEKLVIPACQAIIDPVADLIPEPMKQFVDPNKLFNDLINGIIDECIQTILRADERK